jgi:hypothetical protein
MLWKGKFSQNKRDEFKGKYVGSNRGEGEG